MSRGRVVVALSGGVDSSVAAALLKQQGYDVIGMMMRLWSEPGRQESNRCCTPEAMTQARRVAGLLGIPFYAVDAQEVFHKEVVQLFINGYAHGDTPNPCLACNRHIRWEFLLKHALAIGADWMATGHYARILHEDAFPIRLLRATDTDKDQSYVLHVLSQDQLKHALFPIGEYTKPQVRQLAQTFNLPVANRPDSQDLCFLGENDYRIFLKRNAPNIMEPGNIIDRQGNILGMHQGLPLYTIGQRKGLGVASHQPLYVLKKNLINNSLVVGQQEELGSTELVTGLVNWISGVSPRHPFPAQVKIRYKSGYTPAMIYLLPNGSSKAIFSQPLRDITPGQAAVFYIGDECLGGGIIQSTS